MCLCKQREKKLGKVSSISLIFLWCQTYWASSNRENANLKTLKPNKAAPAPWQAELVIPSHIRAELSGVLPVMRNGQNGPFQPQEFMEPLAQNNHITYSLLLYIPDSGQGISNYPNCFCFGNGPFTLDKGSYKQQHFCLLRLRVRFYMLWED